MNKLFVYSNVIKFYHVDIPANKFAIWIVLNFFVTKKLKLLLYVGMKMKFIVWRINKQLFVKVYVEPNCLADINVKVSALNASKVFYFLLILFNRKNTLSLLIVM